MNPFGLGGGVVLYPCKWIILLLFFVCVLVSLLSKAGYVCSDVGSLLLNPLSTSSSRTGVSTNFI